MNNSRWIPFAEADIARARERKQHAQRGRRINSSLIGYSMATTLGLLLAAAGFAMAPHGGGWFAIALTCWIAGGAYALTFGAFLVATLLDLVKWKGEKP
jgi:hypothetical protein